MQHDSLCVNSFSKTRWYGLNNTVTWEILSKIAEQAFVIVVYCLNRIY